MNATNPRVKKDTNLNRILPLQSRKRYQHDIMSQEREDLKSPDLLFRDPAMMPGLPPSHAESLPEHTQHE